VLPAAFGSARERERERKERERIHVHLGTFVWPRTPFPYYFEEQDRGKENDKDKAAVDQKNKGSPLGKGKEGEQPLEADDKTLKDRDGKALPANSKPNEELPPPPLPPPPSLPPPPLLPSSLPPMPSPSSLSFKDKEVITHVTILLPSSSLPLIKPSKPRLWGGCVSPNTFGVVGMGIGPRVYTDDSDVFLCALHSGHVSWSGARRARAEGRDLKVELRLWRLTVSTALDGEGGGGDVESGGGGEVIRFTGGWGERYLGGIGMGGTGDEEDDGRGLCSASWGVTHDGSAMEVLSARFVEVRFLFFFFSLSIHEFIYFSRRERLVRRLG
jgi:hypothetical protein